MASDSNKWYKKAFGDNLIHCKEVANHNLNVGDRNYVQVDTIFDDFCKAHGRDGTLIIGVYFTPVEGAPDESTNYLVQLYQSINNVSDELHNSNVCDKNMKDQKVSLEVISVFLTSSIHWLDRCTIDEAKVYDQLKDFPWYAVPVGDRDRMVGLICVLDVRVKNIYFYLFTFTFVNRLFTLVLHCETKLPKGGINSYLHVRLKPSELPVWFVA